MSTILSKLGKDDVVHDPFPHVVAVDVLDDVTCDQLLREIPSLETIALQKPYHGNQRLTLGAHKAHAEPSVSPLWKEFLKTHVSQEFLDDFFRVFGDSIKRIYPDFEQKRKSFSDLRAGVRKLDKFKTADILLDAQICANTPVDKPSSVRGPHVDLPDKLFAGLLYLRDPRDDSKGGNLEIYRKKEGKGAFHWDQFMDPKYIDLVHTVPYRRNALVIFPNSLQALHGVTVRETTSWPRYFVNFIGEVKEPLFDLKSHQENFIKRLLRGKKPPEY